LFSGPVVLAPESVSATEQTTSFSHNTCGYEPGGNRSRSVSEHWAGRSGPLPANCRAVKSADVFADSCPLVNPLIAHAQALTIGGEGRNRAFLHSNLTLLNRF
jgi:hypothetical protein